MGLDAETNDLTFENLCNYLAKGMKDVEGWLAYIDGEILQTILIGQAGPLMVRGACAEIGVHHGKSFIALCLGLAPPEKAYCIDIFSDQHLNRDRSGNGNREILERNLLKFGVNPKNRIIAQGSSLNVNSRDVIEAVGRVRFFSVDGGHWLEIVRNDLAIAEEALCDGGVIALDDFHRSEWPTVSAGYFEWHRARKRNLMPFAIGFNKLYLCEEQWISRYQNLIAINAKLKPFLVKTGEFQGIEIPIYSEYILPEFGIFRRLDAYVKIFLPRLYLFGSSLRKNVKAHLKSRLSA